MEVGRDEKIHRRTSKKIYCFTLELVKRFLEESLPSYFNHKMIDHHQKNVIKELKKNSTENEMLVHVDFAKNYSCKYAAEIQSILFGDNRA